MRETEIFALDFPCISISILQGSFPGLEVILLSHKMFGSYKSTFYRWTAAFYGMEILQSVNKLSWEIWLNFGIFGPYCSVFITLDV